MRKNMRFSYIHILKNLKIFETLSPTRLQEVQLLNHDKMSLQMENSTREFIGEKKTQALQKHNNETNSIDFKALVNSQCNVV